MARLPIPPINPNNPIPNTPFFTPPANYVKGEYSPFVIGSGLTLDQITGVLSATGGVAGIIAGPGISVVTGGTPPGATSTISNTGVITLAATAPLVVGGTPSNRTLTVDVATVGTTGVVSIGSNISVSPTGVISVATGTTTTPGIVQLNNTTSSSLTTQALTAAQGKALQDQINALVISSNLTFAGTLDTVTGNMISVTAAGTAAGFAASSPLPAAAALNNECFVIVEVPAASYTPPGGTATQTHVGDWFLSDGTAWSFLNVGFDPPYATTTTPGVVELATDAETQAGTDATLAVTPASAAATYVPLADYTAKGDILAATAAGTPAALTVGANGRVLYANSACATGLCWGALPPATPNATPSTAGKMFGCTGDGFSSPGLTALGFNVAGDNITTGTGNVAIGGSTAYWWTSGSYNVAVGDIALFAQTNEAENNNTAVGYAAAANGGGSNNSLLGTCAGYYVGCSNTGGDNNTFIGYQSGKLNSSGVCNVFLGALSGCTVTTGSCNVAIGPGAAVASVTGSCQLAIGYSPTANWLTGDSTKAIKPGAGIIDCANSCGTAGQVLASNGANAVCWRTIGDATSTVAGIIKGCTNNTCFNTFLGCSAGGTGSCCNTAIGYCAGPLLAAGSYDTVAIGFCSLAAGTTVRKSIAIGSCALVSNVTANQQIAIGPYALGSLTAGSVNTAVGEDTGMVLTSGCRNSFFGYQAGVNLTSGDCNVAIGNLASLASATGSCQLAIGFSPTDNWLTGTSTKAIKPGAGIIDCAGSCGTACQILISTGSNAIAWANSTAPSKLTSTKALTSGVPVDLLSWASGVRMGALDIFATDGSTNFKWANAYVGSSSGVGTSAITFQSTGMGNFTTVAGGSGETIIRFTPSVTLASVNFVFQYNAAFGNQPSVL